MKPFEPSVRLVFRRRGKVSDERAKTFMNLPGHVQIEAKTSGDNELVIELRLLGAPVDKVCSQDNVNLAPDVAGPNDAINYSYRDAIGVVQGHRFGFGGVISSSRL